MCSSKHRPYLLETFHISITHLPGVIVPIICYKITFKDFEQFRKPSKATVSKTTNTSYNQQSVQTANIVLNGTKTTQRLSPPPPKKKNVRTIKASYCSFYCKIWKREQEREIKTFSISYRSLERIIKHYSMCLFIYSSGDNFLTKHLFTILDIIKHNNNVKRVRKHVSVTYFFPSITKRWSAYYSINNYINI